MFCDVLIILFFQTLYIPRFFKNIRKWLASSNKSQCQLAKFSLDRSKFSLCLYVSLLVSFSPPLTAPSWRGSLFFFKPQQRRQKQYWYLTGPVGKPQEEGIMSTSVSFPSVWNQGSIDQYDKETTFEGCCYLTLARRQKIVWCVVDDASSNVEPVHNTTKLLCPNLQWGCQSHRFAENKGLNV
jgi:hypothetical protein